MAFEGVVVRVKRKRDDAADVPQTLVLPQKRARTAPAEIASALESLTVTAASAHSDGALAQAQASRKRALVCTLVANDAEARSANRKRARVLTLENDGTAIRSAAATSPHMDDELDFALYHTLDSGDFALLDQLLSDARRDVNFQRPSDGATALMAACRFCDVLRAQAYLARGADPGLLDSSGRDAAAHVEESARAAREPDLKEELFKLLGASAYEYVYDTYVVQREVDMVHDTAQWDLGAPAAAAGSTAGVWRASGEGAWDEHARVVDCDVDAWEAESGLTLAMVLAAQGELESDAEESAVEESDVDNEDDENYRHNDYPDDEDDEQEDEDDDDY